MRRVYHSCPTCRRRMRLLGVSAAYFNSPSQPVERYYHCPKCEAEWTYNVERHLQIPGVPDEVGQRNDT